MRIGVARCYRKIRKLRRTASSSTKSYDDDTSHDEDISEDQDHEQDDCGILPNPGIHLSNNCPRPILLDTYPMFDPSFFVHSITYYPDIIIIPSNYCTIPRIVPIIYHLVLFDFVILMLLSTISVVIW